jgi:hypothetical protein
MSLLHKTLAHRLGWICRAGPGLAARPNTLQSPYPLQSLPIIRLKHQRRNPNRFFLAGYLINRETALRLGFSIQDKDLPTSIPDDIHYPPTVLERAIRKDLFPKGPPYKVVVTWIGGRPPFDTIFATRGDPYIRHRLPKLADEEKDRDVREWLEAKGECYLFCTLSNASSLCLQASIRENINGKSSPSTRISRFTTLPVLPFVFVRANSEPC